MTQTIDIPITDTTEAILQEINHAFGMVPNLFLAYAKHPALLEANWKKVKAVLLGGLLRRKMKEIIALLVSVDNNCTYCFAAHSAALQSMRVQKNQIDALLLGIYPPDTSLSDVALINFARRVNQYWREIKESDLNALKQMGISEVDIIEVLGVVELFAGFNRFARAMQIEVDF